MSGKQARKFQNPFCYFFKKKCQDRQEEHLVSHMCSEPADGKFIFSFITIYYLVLQFNDHNADFMLIMLKSKETVLVIVLHSKH